MKVNKRIIVLLCFVSLLFLSQIGYLSYWAIFRASSVASMSYNKRNWASNNNVLRGGIYDRVGTPLATSTRDANKNQKRKYPFAKSYAHIIGYNSQVYSQTGLENTYNDLLSGKDPISKTVNIIAEQARGADLTLTIDNNLQQVAYKAMGDKVGSIVALNPYTGEVLAMVSTPSFNINEEELTQNWNKYINNKNNPFFSRATNGLYQPGSTFKTVVGTSYLENLGIPNDYNDTGKITIHGKDFKNYGNHKYGKVNFFSAFAKSSNTAFATWGSKLGGTKLRETAEKFGFNKPDKFDIALSTSKYPDKKMDLADVAASSIGQWEVQATPLQMAKVASIVANGGINISPYLVEYAKASNGTTAYQHTSKNRSRVMTTDTNRKMKKAMSAVVEYGTGTGAGIAGITAAGKTGTAENEKSRQEHAWFIGYAPADNPKIAFAILHEYSGKTGASLVPIANKLIAEYFK